MEASTALQDNIRDILELARLAPSVHNTQPWLVGLRDGTVVIDIDHSYTLHDGDPTGRETTLSLGIFTEAIVLTAKEKGFASKVAFIDEQRIEIHCSPDSQKTQKSYAELLLKRSTDRSIYKKISVSDENIARLKQTGIAYGVQVHVRTDAEFIQTMSGLTGKGIRLALTNPSFRRELSDYLVLPHSSKKRGIAVRSLYLPPGLGWIEPFLMRRGIALDAEARLEEKRWLSSSGVLCLTTPGDLHDDWFKAGRTYLHAALLLEEMGYSQATSAATVEASTFHEDIEHVLNTSQRLQSTIRFGKGKASRNHSPRISVKDLLH